MKIYELATKLGLGSKELIKVIEDLGLAAPKSHFEVLSEDICQQIERHVIREALSAPASAEEEPEKEREQTPLVEEKMVVVRRNSDTSTRKSVDVPKEGAEVEMPESLLGTKVEK